MRVVCAKRNRRSGSAAPSLALRLWIARVWQTWAREKEPGAGVCRFLEVESEGAAFGERASAIGEADRRDGTLVCLALRAGAVHEHLGTEHSSPRDWPADLDGNPCRKRVAVAFWRKGDSGLTARRRCF